MKHTYFLIAIAILILPLSASATVIDDFNTCSVATWTLVGSWTTESTAHLGETSCNAVTSWSGGGAITRSMQHSVNTVQSNKYWSFDFYRSLDGASGASFSFDQNSTSAGTFTIYAANSLTSSIPGYAPQTLVTAAWYRLTVAMSGNNAIVTIYDNSLAVVNTQTVAYTPIINPDRITFTALTPTNANVNLKIDNVIVSEVAPATGTSIQWINSAYTVGDSPSFTWQITDSDWNSHPLQIYVLRLYKSGIMQDWGTFNWACLCSTQLAVAQTGTYVVYADVPGTYLVTLELMTPLIGGNTIVSQSSTSVHAKTSSYFTIAPTAFIKTNTTATYHIGIGGVVSSIDWYFLDNGVEVREAGKILPTTDGDINITFSQVGVYNVYINTITGKGNERLQTHTVTTMFIAGIPTSNWAYNNISLLNNVGIYHMNDALYGKYNIAAVNYTQEGVFFIDIFNYDTGAETTTYYGSGSSCLGVVGYCDWGMFTLAISNNANDVVKTFWTPGNNSVRLMVQKPNNDLVVLAYINFTLSSLTVDGYGLDVSPLSVKTNQKVMATVTSPTSNNASLEISGNNGYFKTYPLAAGTVTIYSSFSREGIYGYNLYGSDGKVKSSQQITVSNVVTNNTNPAIPPISTTGTDISGLLQSKIFWTLVFIVGIMLAVSMRERKP